MLHRTTDVDGRCRLRSAATSTLLVPSTRRLSLGDRAFPVAALRAWNNPPADVRDVPSDLPTTFKDVFVSLFIWPTLIALDPQLLCKVPLQHFCVKRHTNQYIFDNKISKIQGAKLTKQKKY